MINRPVWKRAPDKAWGARASGMDHSLQDTNAVPLVAETQQTQRRCVCAECRPLIAFFLSVDDLSSFKQDFSFCLEMDFQSVWNMCIMRNFSAENDWKRIRWRSILITSFCRCFRWIKSNSKICIEAVSHNCQQSWFADIAWVAGETVEALGKVFWGTDKQTIGQ